MTSLQTSGGFIIRIMGAEYFVVDGDIEVRCSVRGNFRIGKSSEEGMPVVGDNVTYRVEKHVDSRGPSGMIISIEPRKSIFARAYAWEKKGYKVLGANLDRVFLVHSLKQPKFTPRLLDRMLVASECDRIEPVICINKVDLACGDMEVEDVISSYRDLGYETVPCSASRGDGVDRLRSLMSGVRSIMAGPSGAGKTSLLKAIQPGLDIRISDVSRKTGKGRHTTTHFEFHPLQGGGYIGDTPGIREFGIWGLSKQGLGGCFRDFEPFIGTCRFAVCTHSHEPECAVKDAVDQGKITKERYESYLKILTELPDRLG
ncbi:MAG: ribosome small subunit-dependent GTPase A [Bacteroidales bacterium]|nr:ribosome small subunit-dependent GTPase A [Candidatus Latescibacterota bacterium]